MEKSKTIQQALLERVEILRKDYEEHMAKFEAARARGLPISAQFRLLEVATRHLADLESAQSWYDFQHYSVEPYVCESDKHQAPRQG